MTTFVLETNARNAACDGIVDLLDVGGTIPHLVIATAASAADLVSIDLTGATAFGNAGATTAGVAKMTASSPTGVATGAGTAAKFRLEDDAATPVKVASGDAGTTATTLDISNTTIAVSDVIKITSMSVTVPAS
jgi:hypothetical protein